MKGHINIYFFNLNSIQKQDREHHDLPHILLKSHLQIIVFFIGKIKLNFKAINKSE